MTLDKKETPENELRNDANDQTRVQSTPDLSTEEIKLKVAKPKKDPFWRAVHWMVNFIAIGWVLNAIVSVKLYKAVVERAPDIIEKSTSGTQGFIDKIASGLGSKNWSASTKEKISKLGKDFVEIIGVGTGGFLVLPLMNFYASVQDNITAFFKADSHKDANGNETPVEIKHKESMPHWVGGRIIGFSSAVALYLAIKFFAGKQYAAANEKVAAWASKNKFIPKFLRPSGAETEYYMAEQIAAATATTALSLSKDYLDKKFPPEVVVESETGDLPKPLEQHTEVSSQSIRHAKAFEKKLHTSHTTKVSDKRALEEAAAGASYASL